jgi:predicted nuclease of restriction endonuclease-like (RecB) superfamily
LLLKPLEQLAKDLQQEFSGISGFSVRNIWNMRSFYLSYMSDEKLQPMVAEISWTHNLIIMQKCKDDKMREFYIRMARKFGWTKNILIHQIENKSYEKTLLNQTVSENIRSQARLAVKDEYTLDFLELVVECALKKSNQPIGVSTYQIVSTLPQELKDQLPAPEQIARLLQGME